jgi:hypothetical protein
MRRKVGTILVALGAFLLVFAPLLKLYVAPRVVIAPTDFFQMTELRGTNASYFDGAKLKNITGASIVAVNTVRGDPVASTADTAVWDYFVSIKDPDRDYAIANQTSRYALNRHTGELINCCGASVEQDTSVRLAGLGVIWPIGRVERKTYPYFDPQTKRAWPMKYQGQDRIQGTTAYRFEQTIPEMKVATVGAVPGALLGLDKFKNYKVDGFYTATVTIWVDPRTGIPIAQKQSIHATNRTKDGAGMFIAAKTDLKTTEKSEKDLVKLSDGYAWKFAAVNQWLPVGTLVLGLFLLAIGVLLPLFESSGGRDERPRSHAKGGPGQAPRPGSEPQAELGLPAPDRPGSDRYSSRS